MLKTLSVVRVAVGVVFNPHGEVLLACRQKGQHLAGLWEFPGGKIEHAETCEQALIRELEEETGIHVLESKPLMCIRHNYPEKAVELVVRTVSRFSGVASGKEGQLIRWVRVEALETMEFPEANRAIVKALNKRV